MTTKLGRTPSLVMDLSVRALRRQPLPSRDRWRFPLHPFHRAGIRRVRAPAFFREVFLEHRIDSGLSRAPPSRWRSPHTSCTHRPLAPPPSSSRAATSSTRNRVSGVRDVAIAEGKIAEGAILAVPKAQGRERARALRDARPRRHPRPVFAGTDNARSSGGRSRCLPTPTGSAPA